MARQWPADEIPDSTVVPLGIYNVTVALKEARSRGSNKLMYQFTGSIVEPAAFAGVPMSEYCVIGSDSDPDADDPDTWKAAIGARVLKRIFKAAAVPLENDIDDMVEAADGQQIAVEVGQETDDGSRDPKYKGVVRNRIVGFYPLGERQPGFTGGTATGTKPAPKPAPAPAAKAPAATPASKAAPAAAPASAPAKAPAAAKSERTLVCGVCEEKVPQSQYGAHVASHEE